jgi:hypothetical protein
MIVTPSTKSITEYTLTLSEADAAEVMTDPYSFGARLAAQLRAAGATSNPNGNGKPVGRGPNSGNFQPKFRATKAGLRKARAGSPNGKARQPAAHETGGSLERLQCPHCPKKIARKYLSHHLATMHPSMSQPVASVA